MAEVRSAAAQAGFIDPEQLIYDCAGAFSRAETAEVLDREWATRVRPVADQLTDQSLGILERIFSLKLSLLRREA